MSSSVSRMDPGLAANEPGGVAAAPTLVDLTAVVTGASRGIGRAVALALAAAGARVLAVSRTGVGPGEPRVVDFEIDLVKPGSVESVVRAAQETFGRSPDVLVNNAGAFLIAPISDTSPESFDRLVALNLSVPFRLVRAFLVAMRTRGRGHIVSLGSVADHVPFPVTAPTRRANLDCGDCTKCCGRRSVAAESARLSFLPAPSTPRCGMSSRPRFGRRFRPRRRCWRRAISPMPFSTPSRGRRA